MAIIPVYQLYQRRKVHEWDDSSEGYTLLPEGVEDRGTCENFDETDGPTFLPQHHPLSYHDIFNGSLNEDVKAASAFVPDVSWERAVEPPEALRELARWAISVPAESLPPSAAPELLAMAAISIGVCPDGMKSWNQE